MNRFSAGAFAAASAMATALLLYASLQVAGRGGVWRAPAGTMPLFWRFEWAMAAAGASAPGFWHLPRVLSPEACRRILTALLLGATGAVMACAAFWP
jgi:hypothetical protein